jgi:predicted nucleic acid-binding protein
MSILVDTNILTRAAQPHHPQHEPAVNSVTALRQRGESLCLAPQNLYECWVVATRPVGENGLGMTPATAQTELIQLKALFRIVDDTPAVLPRWERLVFDYQVIGKGAHDTRLVATMIMHEITHILTFNRTDFQRYREITVITPESVPLSTT